MLLKLLRAVIACFVLIVFTGCAKHYIQTYPVSLKIKNDTVLEIGKNVPVSIKVIQEPDEVKVHGAGAYGSYYADKVHWSYTVAELLAARLKEKGAIITKDSTKTISLSISDADFNFWSQGGTGIVEVEVKVKTGEGYTATYQGEGTNQGKLPSRPGGKLAAITGTALVTPNAVTESVSRQQRGWTILMRNKSNHALADVVEKIVKDIRVMAYLMK